MSELFAYQARELIEKFPNDVTASFLFTKALIEHISLTLNEEGSSAEVLHDACNINIKDHILLIALYDTAPFVIKVRDSALLAAHTQNPFVIWTLLNSKDFFKVIDVRIGFCL